MLYQSVKNCGVALTITTFILVGNSAAIAEADSFKIGQITGVYLGATDLMVQVANSDCSEYVTKQYDFNRNKNDILSHLTGQNKSDIISFLNGDGMRIKRSENADLVKSYILKTKNEGKSLDYTCGTLIGIVSSVYANALNDWNGLKAELTKEKHSMGDSWGNKDHEKYCGFSGDLWLLASFEEKTTQLEQDLYKEKVASSKWSRSYRKIKKELKKTYKIYDEWMKLKEEFCDMKDTTSSEYYDTKLKLKALEEILDMREK